MMEFSIDQSPPSDEAIKAEREQVLARIKEVKLRDTILSFIFITVVSTLMAMAVYWTTGKSNYAIIAVLAFPIIAIVLHFFGIATNMGFRGAAKMLIDLNHDLVALSEVTGENDDVTNLTKKYKEVDSYREQTKEIGRELVNGELSMFWEWDASTMAKQDKAKAYVEQAKKSVST